MDADGSGVEQYTSPLPVRLLFLQRSHAESSEVASPRTISCILGPGGVAEVVAAVAAAVVAAVAAAVAAAVVAAVAAAVVAAVAAAVVGR